MNHLSLSIFSSLMIVTRSLHTPFSPFISTCSLTQTLNQSVINSITMMILWQSCWMSLVCAPPPPSCTRVLLYHCSLVVLYTQIHAKAMVGNDDAFTPDESWHRKLRYTIGKEYAGGYGDDDDDGATFRQARGMAFDHHRGLLLVVDRNNDRVQALASVDGSFVCKFGSRGDQERQFRAPVAVAIDKDRSLDVDHIIVVDAGNERLQLWPLNEQAFSSYVSKRFTGLNFSAVAIDKRRRRIIIVDRGRNRLVALSLLDFSLVFTIGDSRCRRPGEFLSPSGVAVDRVRDRIIAVDSFNHRIQVFAALDGAFLFEFGDEGNEPGQFNCPLVSVSIIKAESSSPTPTTIDCKHSLPKAITSHRSSAASMVRDHWKLRPTSIEASSPSRKASRLM